MDAQAEYLSKIRELLYTAVISDVLDSLGRREQVMSAHIKPLSDSLMVVGRAFPVRVVDTYTDPATPYESLIASLQAIQPGEVYVAATSPRAAFWGELLSTFCQRRGAAGAVIDGLVRDVRRIRDLGFPVFSTGYYPVDSKGRLEVLDFRVPIHCGGVLVCPGDLIVADVDGVVAVPAPIEDQVISLAFQKLYGENEVREGLQSGLDLKDLYKTFGVL